MMDSAVVVPRGGGGGRRGARTAVRSSEGVVDVDAMVVDDPAPTSTASSTTSSRLVSSNRRDVEVDLEHQSNPTIEASTALNMLVDSTLASTAKESDTSTSTTSKRTRVTGTKRPAPTTTPPTAAATTAPAAGGSGGATEEVMVVKRGRGRPRKDGLPNRSATLVPIASLSKPKPKPPAKASTPAPPNDTDEDEGDAADDGTYDENLVERDTPSSTTTRASRVRGSKAAELAASTTLLKWMASSSDSSSSSSSTSATSATPTTASKAPTATDIPILPNCMPLLSNLTLVSTEAASDFWPSTVESPVYRFTGSNVDAQLERFDSTQHSQSDMLLNVGGRVNALAWAPRSPAADDSRAYVAIGVNNTTTHFHLQVKQYRYRNMLQIWQFDTNGVVAPKLVLGICHEGGSVYDLQWCPNSYAAAATDSVEAGRLGHEGGGISRLGLLLVASSDGTARVYAVPDPHDLARRVAPTTASTPSSSSSSPERLFITAIPACEFQLKDTVLLSVRWFFLNGRVGVLVGAVNGNVGYWHIRPTIPFFQFTPMVPSYSGLAHPRAIKGLCFSPLEPYRFISAGHDSHVRFWDLRDPAQPIYDHAATGPYPTSVQWSRSGPDSADVFIGAEDGSVRHFQAGNAARVYALTKAAIWDIHCNGGLVAACGMDGNVVLFAPEQKRKRDRLKEAVQLSSVELSNGVLVLQDQPCEAKLVKIGSPSFDPIVAATCVRWREQIDDTAAGKYDWLCIGMASGLVRCMRVLLS